MAADGMCSAAGQGAASRGPDISRRDTFHVDERLSSEIEVIDPRNTFPTPQDPDPDQASSQKGLYDRYNSTEWVQPIIPRGAPPSSREFCPTGLETERQVTPHMI